MSQEKIIALKKGYEKIVKYLTNEINAPYHRESIKIVYKARLGVYQDMVKDLEELLK